MRRNFAEGGLRKWVAEKWVDIGAPKKDGKYQPCGRKKGSKRKYPKCVPLAKATRMTKSQKASAVKRKRAQDRGKVRTLLGRLCRFPLWEPNQFGIHKPLPHAEALAEHGPGIRRAFTYKALNKLIQGSAADMTKKAMVELYKEGITPHIQVHDELDISVNNNADKIKEIMEHAVELEVPNKVDYESGPNWGNIK
jgi:DNA polymerase I-like protein with 3'-5' exonuclease and polymerase domains